MQSDIFIQTENEMLAWFFYWGNIFFIALGIILVVYIFLHAYFKGISALIYKLFTIIPIVLIIPSLVFTLSSYQKKVSLEDYIILFFILGLIGGITPIVSSVAYSFYFISVPKKKYCSIHNIYYKEDKCPFCAISDEDTDFSISSKTKVEKISKVKGLLINKSIGKSYMLSNMNILGRGSMQKGEGNKINISDSYVSRTHTKIVFDGNRFKICDSSSRSGTYVNGQKIKGWVTLDDNDEIKIGKTYLKFTHSK